METTHTGMFCWHCHQELTTEELTAIQERAAVIQGLPPTEATLDEPQTLCFQCEEPTAEAMHFFFGQAF
jgi:uncharacterized CHY-type Zn-finger protein